MHGEETEAIVDTAAPDNFLHPRYIPAGRHLQPAPREANLASNQAVSKILGEASLTLEVDGHPTTLSTLITPRLWESRILGLP